MNKGLIRFMHWFVLGPVGVVGLILALYYLDPYDYDGGGGELGNALLYAALYFQALVCGFLGWVSSIILLIKERHARTKQSAYAAFYVLLGIIGFSWAYYLMQAS